MAESTPLGRWGDAAKEGLDMKLNQFISALSKVRKTGPDSWVACCPSHKDKSPSLAIKATPETMLIHCFAGCSTEEILDAVGMTFDDLYPDHGRTVKPHKLHPRAALECIAFESLVVAASGYALRSRPLTVTEMERLVQATSRIQAAAEMAGV